VGGALWFRPDGWRTSLLSISHLRYPGRNGQSRGRPTRLPQRDGAHPGQPHTYRGRDHDEPSKRIQRHGRLFERAQHLGRLRRTPTIDRRSRLDAEGAVWVADVFNNRLIRVVEGGTIVEERKTDGVNAFACMLGGKDGRTLFACAAPTFKEPEASLNHRASILMTKVEVPHAGLP
jgi:hypothetical protein